MALYPLNQNWEWRSPRHLLSLRSTWNFVTLPSITMVQWKMGVSPIESLPFKYRHFPLNHGDGRNFVQKEASFRWICPPKPPPCLSKNAGRRSEDNDPTRCHMLHSLCDGFCIISCPGWQMTKSGEYSTWFLGIGSFNDFCLWMFS